MLDEIRCGTCSKKLGEGKYRELEIKCPRCGTLNYLRAAPSPSPERPRASTDKETAREDKENTP